MLITNSNYSIIEIIQMLERRELLVNSDYQRGSAIWPSGPSSYFIDTIISKFPFPKIYLFEDLDRGIRGIRREIVDGQQRINAISRFYRDEFPLGRESAFPGKRFSELPEEIQHSFLGYTVSVDVIRNATKGEILEMFRRMNAYTLPLNEAEKRHSSHQGKFKWFVNRMADDFSDFFVDFGILTPRQIVRMADAALIADVILAIERGVISSSPSDLNSLYRENDSDFPEEERLRTMLSETKGFICNELGSLRKSFLMKPYAVHSLFTALIQARFGIPPLQKEWNIQSQGVFCLNVNEGVRGLHELALAHEAKEIDGEHGGYVWGCLSTTDRKNRRTARVAAVLRVLGLNVPVDVDAELT